MGLYVHGSTSIRGGPVMLSSMYRRSRPTSPVETPLAGGYQGLYNLTGLQQRDTGRSAAPVFELSDLLFAQVENLRTDLDLQGGGLLDQFIDAQR